MNFLLKRSCIFIFYIKIVSAIPKTFDPEVVEKFYLSNLSKFVIQKQNPNVPYFSMV